MLTQWVFGRRKRKGKAEVFSKENSAEWEPVVLSPKVLIKISGKSIPCKPSCTNLQRSQRCCPGFSNDIDQTRCVSGGNIIAGAKWLFLKFYSLENRIHKSHREIPEEPNVLERCVYVCVCVCACSVVSNSVTRGTIACQAPLSMEFSRQEYRSRLPFLL